MYESHGFLHGLEDPSEDIDEGASESPSDGGEDRSRPNLNDGIDFVRKIIMKISNVTKIQKLST